MSAREQGKQVEQQVCRFLQKQGMQLITRNYHSRGGEIDLIMQDRQTLVFIEVRFRKSRTFGSALESVNKIKQSRIIHTAEHYLQRHPVSQDACRFDVVAVSPTASGHYDFQWIKDAFQNH
ncbi:YraN family protein [Methylophaga sp. OBS4]|uniref:YraN family protein n=1 Tax=Methylophaga sp. OBS4 TaxID=2991935 RepID=UPI002258B33B|nr:YraN family protein [Methylophaga sp. OBS4]MCX4187221.1 YraN family protein [Methylophaga sp. OBS4]